MEPPMNSNVARRQILSMALGLILATPVLAQDKHTVLVVGASGGTGRFIIGMLQEQGYEVVPTSRNPERAAETVGGDFSWRQMDLTSRESVDAAVRDVDFVVTAHGATEAQGSNDPEQVDWIGTRHLIDVAGKIGVKHYVMISAASAGNPDSPLNERFGNVLVWKGRAEDYLRDSGLTYTIVRGPGLRDNPGGEKPIVLEQGGSGRRLLEREDLATVTVAALDNEAAYGKTFVARNAEGGTTIDLNRQLESLQPD